MRVRGICSKIPRRFFSCNPHPAPMRQDHREIATTVANDPHSYKLCLVCGAIVDKAADTCPDCMAYRFDTSAEHVADRALDLGKAPSNAVSHLDSLD